MRLYDTPRVFLGLAVFLVAVSFPLWYNIATGKGSVAPEPEKPKGEKQCVADTKYMKAYHMDLLNNWRNEVVRDGDREFESSDGRKFDKSLSRTCLKCHQGREKFCMKCHNYAGVKEYCWDCHLEPKDER